MNAPHYPALCAVKLPPQPPRLGCPFRFYWPTSSYPVLEILGVLLESGAQFAQFVKTVGCDLWLVLGYDIGQSPVAYVATIVRIEM